MKQEVTEGESLIGNFSSLNWVEYGFSSIPAIKDLISSLWNPLVGIFQSCAESYLPRTEQIITETAKRDVTYSIASNRTFHSSSWVSCQSV